MSAMEVMLEADWKKYLSTQSKILSAARLGNWLSVASTAILYYATRQGAREAVGAIHTSKLQAQEDAQRILNRIESMGDLVTASIDSLGCMLDKRLTLVSDQLRVANAVSENILEILHVPEFQKERRYYYEQGLRHYANARFDDSLYADALRNFLEAESRDPSDPQVLYRIGLIYLYTSTQCNLRQAQAYLARAGKYAFISAQSGAARTAGVLNLIGKDTQELREHKIFGARVLTDLSVCLFVEGKVAEALLAAEKAIGLAPDHLLARVQHLRALCESSQTGIQEAALALLKQNPEAVAVLIAEDLVSHAGVQSAVQIYLGEQMAADEHALADLLPYMEDIEPQLKILAGESLREAEALWQNWRNAGPSQKADAASALLRKLNATDARLNFKQNELRASLKATGKINWVHFLNRGRLAVIVAELPTTTNATEGAFQYELTTIAIEGGRAAMRRVNCHTRVEKAIGVLDKSGILLLDGASHLYDARSLLPTEQLQPSDRVSAVFLHGAPCWIRIDDHETRWTLSDARTGETLRQEPLKSNTITLGAGSAARDITIHADPIPTCNPDLFAFDCVDTVESDEVEIFLSAVGSSLRLPLNLQSGSDMFDARLSENGAILLVRFGSCNEPARGLHVVDTSNGAVLQTQLAEGLLPAFTPRGVWIGRQEGLPKQFTETFNCDNLAIACAAWENESVTINPGPGANSLIDFIEAWRRAQAIEFAGASQS